VRDEMADSKSRSLVWQYFVPTPDDVSSATCNLCRKKYKRPQGNTTNMTAHLKRDHRREFQEFTEAEQRKKLEAAALKQVRTKSLKLDTGYSIIRSGLASRIHKWWASPKLCGVEQRAPPIFGRATITFCIGPHF